MLLSSYEFCKTGVKMATLFLSKLHVCVYHKNIWHSKHKEHLGEVCTMPGYAICNLVLLGY